MGFLGKKVYLHIHGASIEDTIKKGDVFGWLTKKLLKYVHVLPSNPDIEKLLIPYNPKSIQEIDAYLPPVFEQEVFDDFKKGIELPDYDFLVTTVGWFKYYDDEDLYGFDILLESLKELKEQNPNKKILFIASVNGIVDEQLHQEFIKKRKEYKLDESFLLLFEDYEEIWPLFVIGDLFIRATNTDGSAVSIKEALWAQSNVLSSDCVPRPDEVQLFKSRNTSSLTEEIQTNITKFEKTDELERIEKIKKEPFYFKLFKEIYDVE
jgi:glycosyltransferase involved in cell wall biosynthesis